MGNCFRVVSYHTCVKSYNRSKVKKPWCFQACYTTLYQTRYIARNFHMQSLNLHN